MLTKAAKVGTLAKKRKTKTTGEILLTLTTYASFPKFLPNINRTHFPNLSWLNNYSTALSVSATHPPQGSCPKALGNLNP
ncbi:MAG: hypothetical protein RL549_1413 [Verrucomicrobiota bacterium]